MPAGDQKRSRVWPGGRECAQGPYFESGKQIDDTSLDIMNMVVVTEWDFKTVVGIHESASVYQWFHEATYSVTRIQWSEGYQLSTQATLTNGNKMHIISSSVIKIGYFSYDKPDLSQRTQRNETQKRECKIKQMLQRQDVCPSISHRKVRTFIR